MADGTTTADDAGIFLCIDTGVSHPHTRTVPLSPPITGSSVLVWKKHGIRSACVAEFVTFLQERRMSAIPR